MFKKCYCTTNINAINTKAWAEHVIIADCSSFSFPDSDKVLEVTSGLSEKAWGGGSELPQEKSNSEIFVNTHTCMHSLPCKADYNSKFKTFATQEILCLTKMSEDYESGLTEADF